MWRPAVFFLPDDATLKPEMAYDGDPLRRGSQLVPVTQGVDRCQKAGEAFDWSELPVNVAESCGCSVEADIREVAGHKPFMVIALIFRVHMATIGASLPEPRRECPGVFQAPICPVRVCRGREQPDERRR
ncbi:hypothetical protein D3227_38040 [Mesorhizobium waimense]|uniref:Uncharacterized protein n=1 Tax=Mesorhizobium waimense TaxID=1300307 RepID=A0A3A5JUN1_9HYPH|nr:hypothetical protein D3227_38040 [Mesorhizobium waimense]